MSTHEGSHNGLATVTPSDPSSSLAYAIVPHSFSEFEAFCKLIAQSDLAPRDFKGKPGNVFVAVQMGCEIGLRPMQAVQNIAVINGRPAVYGDAALALIKQHPLFESCKEEIAGSGDARAATCTMVRKGEPPIVRTFSVLDAKRARLWDKQGPWTDYPDRMLQMRARGFAGRDAFPDALKGLSFAEEAMDIPSGEPAKPAPTRTQSVIGKLAPPEPTQEVIEGEAVTVEPDTPAAETPAEITPEEEERRNAIRSVVEAAKELRLSHRDLTDFRLRILKVPVETADLSTEQARALLDALSEQVGAAPAPAS